MKKTLALAAILCLGATAALAQASSGNAMMKSSAPSNGAAMSAAPDTAAAPKKAATKKVSKKEAALNAQEADVTKQLNEQQASYASGAMK